MCGFDGTFEGPSNHNVPEGSSDNPYDEARRSRVGVGIGPGGFNLRAFSCLFENPKMFYPPEGLCRAEPERGPIVFTLHFIGVGRGIRGFQFIGGFLPF